MPSAIKQMRNQVYNFRLITLFIVAVFHIFVLSYIKNLERIHCDCSKQWQRDFIKYYSLVAIVISTSLFITGISGSDGRLPAILSSLLAFAGLINAFIVFFYTKKLMNCDDRCECSEGMVRTVIHYLSAFRVLMTLFVFLVAIFIVIFLKKLV